MSLWVSTPRITSSARAGWSCVVSGGWGKLAVVTRLLGLGLVADAGPVGGQNCDGAQCSKAPIGTRSPSRRRQSPLGAGRRQILNRASAASCPTGQAPGPQRHTTMLTVVPHQDDRAAELGVGADDQIAVVLPAEALRFVLAAPVLADRVDQPGPLAGLVAGHARHGDA